MGGKALKTVGRIHKEEMETTYEQITVAENGILETIPEHHPAVVRNECARKFLYKGLPELLHCGLLLPYGVSFIITRGKGCFSLCLVWVTI